MILRFAIFLCVFIRLATCQSYVTEDDIQLYNDNPWWHNLFEHEEDIEPYIGDRNIPVLDRLLRNVPRIDNEFIFFALHKKFAKERRIVVKYQDIESFMESQYKAGHFVRAFLHWCSNENISIVVSEHDGNEMVSLEW